MKTNMIEIHDPREVNFEFQYFIIMTLLYKKNMKNHEVRRNVLRHDFLQCHERTHHETFIEPVNSLPLNS